MKKYISMVVAALIIVLFTLNYNSIFNYEKITEDTYVEPYAEDFSILENGYMAEKEYDTRPSILNLITKSGGVGGTNMQFNKPDEFEDLTEEDNQKIFFFGRLDPDKPEEGEVIGTDDGKADSWDEWGYEGTTNPGPPPEFSEGGIEIPTDLSTPIEVNLEQFLTK